MALTDDLVRLADTLSPSEIPGTLTTDRLVGALIKVLDHRQLTVDESLYPRPEEQRVSHAPPAVESRLEDLFHRVEAAVSKLEGHAGAPVSAPAPVQPPPGAAPFLQALPAPGAEPSA